ESFLPRGNEKLRLAGSNRYKTSVEVAKAFKTVLNKDIDTVIIASGEDYPDALSAGPLASSKNAAILLTEAKGLNPDVKKYIEETKSIKNVIIEETKSIKNVIIVGGESTVSAQVEKDLATIAR
ncbi:MAG: cell wall-binding repeat-containing protein, partial [Peptostreptococcus sp.]|uniref:cell wall-binding repeat-containing protein n=1 Tax=Peptostreptococcus sp. TaxID=1262 RepID=UPI0029065AEC